MGCKFTRTISFMRKDFILEDTNKEWNGQQTSSPLLHQKKWQHYFYVTTTF